MRKTLVLSFALRNTYRVNGILYSIKQIPLVGRLLPEKLYSVTALKLLANILSVLWEVVSVFLGKLIYFMDAACDLEEDRKKGQYNPLALLGVQSGADFRPQLTLLAGDAAEAFEGLPIVQDAAILQNILYSGVWTRFEAAFRTKQEEST